MRMKRPQGTKHIIVVCPNCRETSRHKIAFRTLHRMKIEVVGE